MRIVLAVVGTDAGAPLVPIGGEHSTTVRLLCVVIIVVVAVTLDVLVTASTTFVVVVMAADNCYSNEMCSNCAPQLWIWSAVL